jgi:hypothetical protein
LIFAQDGELVFELFQSEKYMGHYVCAGTQCSGTFSSAENQAYNPLKIVALGGKVWTFCTSMFKETVS